MKDFQIMRYLKKFQVYILVFSLLLGALFYYVVSNKMQSYTASTVIEYTNEEAASGQTPSEEKLDPNEMLASNIIIQVMENLGMDPAANMDGIRKNVSIEPIISDEELMLQEAQLEQGIAYEIYPTRYVVSFTADVAEGKEYARTVLNEILDVYIAAYGEQHVNTTGGANDINDIYGKGYDYIEMMDVISASLNDTMEVLASKIGFDGSFRSYKTGYSFSDLFSEFELLSEIEVPKISADIVHNQITKDRDVLLAKLRNENNDLAIENEASVTEIEKIKGIINAYVALMSYADDVNQDYYDDHILQEVYDNYYLNSEGAATNITDQTTEYDLLLKSYVKNRNQYEDNLIDTAYNEYLIEVFASAPAESPEAQQQRAQESIAALVSKVNTLYAIFNETNDEYNEYLGANNITVLATVGVTEAIPVKMYTVLIILVFGVIGCVGAIVLGRMGDIIDYYAFTHKVDGLPNRAKCDQHIAKLAQRVLPGEFSFVAFRLENLKEVNEAKGRQQGDKLMKNFADILTDVFRPSENVFVGYNGSGQYLVFAEDMTGDQTDAALKQIQVLVRQMTEAEHLEARYSCGMANSQDDSCFRIRKLLSLGMKRMAENSVKAETGA